MIREPEFAKRLAASRTARNLSQIECARLMGVSRQHFSNWEAGICKPKGERMIELARVLQCDSVWLRHGESSELEQRLETAMLLMRSVVRELDHIHKALGENAKKSRGIADPAIRTLLDGSDASDSRQTRTEDADKVEQQDDQNQHCDDHQRDLSDPPEWLVHRHVIDQVVEQPKHEADHNNINDQRDQG